MADRLGDRGDARGDGLALIAQLLFGRALWTFVAGLLLALEHLSVVLSRQALLDIHLQLWIVAGFLCLVLDRRWMDRRTPRGPPAGPDGDEADGEVDVPSPLWRPWRYAAGIAFGAAVSVKWSGGLGMFTAIVVSLMWETSRRRRGDTTRRGAFARALAQESFALVLAFVLIPTVVYLVAYLPWLHHFDWNVSAIFDQQLRIAEYHLFVLKTEAIGPCHRGAHADALRLLAAMDWLWMKRRCR